MAKRKDGKETRKKLLDAACEVFAEKGFRETKITDICRRAGANVAAVNYYFGDKASLYVTAWRQAMEKFVAAEAKDLTDLSSKERLRLTIHQIIDTIIESDDTSGHLRRMELMEIANPTGLIDETWKEGIAPYKQAMNQMIRDIIGPDATEESVLLCEMSIINQCRGFILLRRNRIDDISLDLLTPERLRKIAEHITLFSLAGINAVADVHKS